MKMYKCNKSVLGLHFEVQPVKRSKVFIRRRKHLHILLQWGVLGLQGGKLDSFSICPSTRKLKVLKDQKRFRADRVILPVSFLRQETARRYIFLTSHFKTSPEFERFTIECRETKTLVNHKRRKHCNEPIRTRRNTPSRRQVREIERE